MAEGTRGGKVIGHTKSGEPIYESHKPVQIPVEAAKKKAETKKMWEMINKYHPDKKKSEGDNMDQLRKLGFTIGQPNLAPIQKSQYDDAITESIKKGGYHALDRQGVEEDTFRSRLEKSLNTTQDDVVKAAIARPVTPPRVDINPEKFGVNVKQEPRQGDLDKPGEQYLKNTHGEEFHDDNDKQVEKFVTSVEPIDRIHDTEHEERAVMMTRSMTQEQLFAKAMGAVEELVGEELKEPAHKDAPKKELKKWAKEEDKEHAKKSELDELVDLIKGGDKLVTMTKEKPVKDLASLHENSPGMGSGKATDEIKKKANNLLAMNAKKSFVKAIGPGGIIFDFGRITGNRMADNATALLQAHGDPQQMENARYQDQSYQKSLMDYVAKGDREHGQNTTPYGNVSKDTMDSLGKSFDKQVQEAFDKGQLDSDPSRPAVVNQFNKSEIKVAGIGMVKATSETDAALIEMMKAEQGAMTTSEGGFVADASTGGKQNVEISI